jgi:hypothetical protein
MRVKVERDPNPDLYLTDVTVGVRVFAQLAEAGQLLSAKRTVKFVWPVGFAELTERSSYGPTGQCVVTSSECL